MDACLEPEPQRGTDGTHRTCRGDHPVRLRIDDGAVIRDVHMVGEVVGIDAKLQAATIVAPQLPPAT